MSTKFNIGDVVILRSGGPRMTVTALETIHISGYQCDWFDKSGNLSHARFPSESLRKATVMDFATSS